MSTSVRKALAFSLLERYLLIVLALVSSIILARLLSPEEIGIYSVSLAVIGIAQVLRDFGIGNYLIQETDLRDDHVRTAFGLSLALGATLFLTSFISAPWIGDFYENGAMVSTLRISALNFLILPFCTISLALLRREMLFKAVATASLAGGLLGFLVTLALAYKGYGSNSLAIGMVASNVAMGYVAWRSRADRGILSPSFSHWRRILRFGGLNSLSSVVGAISIDINDLAIGKILGLAPVAQISRAQGLMNMFHRDIMSAVRGVAYPAFAQSYRDGSDLEAQHTNAMAIVIAFAWPFYAFVAAFSQDLVMIMYGAQWISSASLVPWFCLAGAVAAPCGLITPWLMAQGRIDIVTKIELFAQPLRAFALVSVVILTRSVDTFAIAFAAVFALLAPFYFYMKGRVGTTHISPLMRVLLISFIVSAGCMVMPLTIRAFVANSAGMSGPLATTISAAFCIASWIGMLFLMNHPLIREPLFIRAMGVISRPRKVQPQNEDN